MTSYPQQDFKSVLDNVRIGLFSLFDQSSSWITSCIAIPFRPTGIGGASRW
jgi:hypothetical protein